MRISALDRKLLRDLWHIRKQALAIAVVIGCGIMMFTMATSTHESLQGMIDAYYDRYRFADVFTHVKRAPARLRERLLEIPGVTQVETRVVERVSLDMPGMAEPATGRIVSLPDHGEPGLNALYLRAGRMPEPGMTGEVMVNEPFAEAHGLHPGDSVTLILRGHREQARIAGVALSPEFIYQITPGEFVPDNRRYGVFWMREHELASAFQMKGAFNDIALRLSPGASLPDVLNRLDTLTKPYGGQGAYGRKDQLSNQYVTDEMKQLKGMAIIPPAIFLSVAAFLLNVVLSRLIQLQREQIAALKAFGYRRGEIAMHFLKMAMIIALAGAVIGIIGGARLGNGLTAMYMQFFRFPALQYRLGPSLIGIAVGVAMAAAALGVLRAVWQAMRLPPAEAMRPEPPARYRPALLERLGLDRFFGQTTRMILRQIERQPVKTLLSVIGIALGMAVMILGGHVKDSADYVIDFQYAVTQRQDLTVTFVEPLGDRVLPELRGIDGVIACEPMRAVPVELHCGHRVRRLAVMGLGEERTLFRPMNEDVRPIAIPPAGLALSRFLADTLGIRQGDSVSLEVLEGERKTRVVEISALVEDFAGTGAYMRLGALAELLGEGPRVSGAFLTVDAARQREVFGRLKERPMISGVTIKTAAWQSFQDTLNESLMHMRFFNVIFASLIAFGVVYNTARVILSERGRELATLRVLGFTRHEISRILLGEVGLLIVLALPLGMAIGNGFARFATLALRTETHRLPCIVLPSTYALAALVVILAGAASGLVVRERVDQLDLIAVLKARE